jgi:hypothetical protein
MSAKSMKVIAGVVLLQLVAVLAFVLPAHKPEPHGVPVGVVAAPPLERQLERAGDGAFDVHAYRSAADAEAAIRDREVYGAVVPAAREVIVASAASPAVAQALRQELGERARVRDIVPVDPDDPRGATINALFLPLIIASLPAALALALSTRTRRALVGALGAMAALGGLLVVTLVGPVLGLLPGSVLALAAVAALIILAMALPTAALVRRFGPHGIAPAALTFLLIGNPGSGNASAPELLPGFWRAVGPLLPPGAGGSALRNVAYFDGAALTRPLLVLVGFAAAGAALLLATRRQAATGHAAAGRPVAHAPAVAAA